LAAGFEEKKRSQIGKWPKFPLARATRSARNRIGRLQPGDGGADAGVQRLTGGCGSERERESLLTMAIDCAVFCGCSYKDADAAAAER